jgi:hypothetical protein
MNKPLTDLIANLKKSAGKRDAPPPPNTPTSPLRLLECIVKPLHIKRVTLKSYDGSKGSYEYMSNTVGGITKIIDKDVEDIVGAATKFCDEAAKVGMDVVLCSTVYTENGSTMHIPMVDLYSDKILPVEFTQKPFTDAMDLHIRKILDVGNPVFFNSGSGYHAYFTRKLLTLEELKAFWAGCLRIPKQALSSESFADWRWIGHCMQADQGLLRLTAVDDHYLQVPEVALDMR